MKLGAISFAIAATLGSTARADDASVDVADLPALPPASGEPSSSATVMAAAAAEEDVVVGAAKREQSLGNVASAVTVISADRIRRFGYRTVSEAIAGVAGVYVQDNRLTNQVGIRGLQVPGGFNSRILVLVDGATINEAWGAFAGVGFDGMVSIDDIARIEVIRGPVSSLYGTNAFFATLNIVTRGAAEGASAWGRVGINSIHGEIATAGFATGTVDKQLRGSVLAMNRIGETSSVPEIAGGGNLEADGANTFVASVVGSYNGTFGQLRAYRSRRDSPFAPYDSDPTLDPGYSLFNSQVLLEGGHTRSLSDRLTVAVRGYSTLYRYYDEIRAASNSLFVDYGDARTFGAEARGRYEVLEAGKLGVTAGAEVNYNQTESRAFDEGDEANGATVPKDFSIQGVYSEIDSQLTPWLGFTGGLRFDRNSVIVEGTRLSPRAALFLAKPDKFGLKLLYAEGFRNPSMFEGFFEDKRDFAENRAIRPETVRSFEAVIWAKVAGLSARASAFWWEAKDVIEQVPIPSPFPAGGDVLQFQNFSRYRTQGVEAEASYRNSQGWYAFGGLAVNAVGQDRADSATPGTLDFDNVVNAPVITASVGASTPPLFGYAHVSAEAQLIGRRNTRPDAETMAESPASPRWLGINAAVYVPSVRGFDLTAGARNLIGTRDLSPAPDDYDRFSVTPAVTVPRIPGEGREVYVKVGYSY